MTDTQTLQRKDSHLNVNSMWSSFFFFFQKIVSLQTSRRRRLPVFVQTKVPGTDKSVEPTLTYFISSATHLDRRIHPLQAPGSCVLPSRSCLQASHQGEKEEEQVSVHALWTSPRRLLSLWLLMRFTRSSATAAGHPVGAIFKYYAYQLCFLNSIFKSQRLCLWQTTSRGLCTETSFSPLEV